jgi:serine/threonine protein kinase
MNEVNILKSLNHPNIIKLIDYQKWLDLDLLVFPYYQLGDLFQVVTYHGPVSSVITD